MEQLTKRELEILPFICFSKKEIAQHFKISICTVNVHLNNLLNKFSVDNRSKLLITALRKGIIKLENVVVRLE
nr:MAG TPA: response regulator [Caudoviricetes sp.]